MRISLNSMIANRLKQSFTPCMRRRRITLYRDDIKRSDLAAMTRDELEAYAWRQRELALANRTTVLDLTIGDGLRALCEDPHAKDVKKHP
jgi:hypothetical protein